MPDDDDRLPQHLREFVKPLKPARFTAAPNQNYQLWELDFDAYCDNAEIPAKFQPQVLRNLIGGRAHLKFKELPEATKQDISLIKAEFRKHFGQATQTTLIHQMMSRRMRPTETPEQVLAELEHMALVAYPTPDDSHSEQSNIIRGRRNQKLEEAFVNAMPRKYYSSLRAKLDHDPVTVFDLQKWLTKQLSKDQDNSLAPDAINAVQTPQTKPRKTHKPTDVPDMNQDSDEEDEQVPADAYDNVNFVQQRHRNQRPAGNPNQNQARYRQHQPFQQTQKFRPQAPNQQNPHRGLTCFHCGKPNHVASNCRSRQQPQQQQQQSYRQTTQTQTNQPPTYNRSQQRFPNNRPQQSNNNSDPPFCRYCGKLNHTVVHCKQRLAHEQAQNAKSSQQGN